MTCGGSKLGGCPNPEKIQRVISRIQLMYCYCMLILEGMLLLLYLRSSVWAVEWQECSNPPAYKCRLELCNGAEP